MMALKQFKVLHNLIDEIYAEATDQGLTWPKLAEKAGLGVATVYNLGNLVTIYPRSQTVFMLARAVGMEITIHKKPPTKKHHPKFRVVG